jgi:hypothetical protein
MRMRVFSRNADFRDLRFRLLARYPDTIVLLHTHYNGYRASGGDRILQGAHVVDAHRTK